jgi:hypothetical protein
MNGTQRSRHGPGAWHPFFHVHQGGQSSLEYGVVCAALAFALFVPIQDDPASPDKARTTVQIVLDGFKSAYQNISHAISLPS